MLHLHNTLTRRQEEFIPLTPGEVKLYTCGPTVYDYAHIGNFRAYVFEDLLRRYFKFKGYKVTQVQNLTDVDDKTIKGARAQGVSLKEYTAKYIQSFFNDLKTLKIEPAEIYPAATGHIPEMISLIARLRDKGVTYESEGSTYFRISAFPSYGKLSGMDASSLIAGARVEVDEYEKEEARDFALWKAWREEDGEVWWDSPFGKGRPGWHIECSAMSMKYLGETFDLHCGGEDNIFPHHENEIAQSEAATGKTFVNYWLHCRFLLVEGRKMSKSLGNFYTLKDILAKGYKPDAVRWLLMSTHYRQPLNFTFDGIIAAENAIQRLKDFLLSLNSVTHSCIDNTGREIVEKAEKEFTEALDDDLNIAPALGAIFTMVKDLNKMMAENQLTVESAQKARQFLEKVNSILGVLDFSAPQADALVDDLIKQRVEARKNRDFKTADAVRKQLTEMGIVLEDTAEGTRWKKI